MSIIGPDHPEHPVQQTLREIRSPRRGSKEAFETYDSGDDICECGHFQSLHEAREEAAVGISVEGHGSCSVAGCECERFVWAKQAHPRWRRREMPRPLENDDRTPEEIFEAANALLENLSDSIPPSVASQQDADEAIRELEDHAKALRELPYPAGPLASRRATEVERIALPCADRVGDVLTLTLSTRDAEALLGALDGPSASDERLAQIFYRVQALMSE